MLNFLNINFSLLIYLFNQSKDSHQNSLQFQSIIFEYFGRLQNSMSL